ncbi:hypothetical protein HXX76_008542 [Chlamydomonas incerta]|uniref:CRAL-TRIO domain-containing protein n=1 Tax=Chlamydomonas incerta TaxID=51695 RepID=A0A835W0L9_CHLIN|nr:hypothetical protein HXX76_008542 [Chlamydomonas incerta]|eukprot:KAG2432808.1 hypothetical protein HXX76_008542 [Chlamydomonas incerta]
MFSRFRHHEKASPHDGYDAVARASLNAPRAVPAQPLRFAGRRDFNFEPGGDDWGLTPVQQEEAVEEFRRRLVELDPGLWDPQRHDFFTLRRFLRARAYHTARAVDMWRAHLEWRRANDVDHVLQDFSFPERSEFLRHAPQGYYHTDRLGRPVYVQLLGAAELGALKRIATEDRMFRFMVHEHEYVCKVMLPLCSRLAGRHVGTIFNIVDVKGLRLSQLTPETLRFFQRVTKMDQDHYPEMLAHVAVINAPPVFRLVWGAVRRFLEPRTQSKIQILGPNYLSALEQWIEPDHLLPLFAREGAAAAAAAAAGQRQPHPHHPHHQHWRHHSSGGVSEEEQQAAARLEEAARQLEGNQGPWRDLLLFERLGLDPQQLRTGLLPPPPQAPTPAPPPPPPPPPAELSPLPAAAAGGHDRVVTPAALLAEADDDLQRPQPPRPAVAQAGRGPGVPARRQELEEEAGRQREVEGEGPELGSESELESEPGEEGCLHGGTLVGSWADLEDLRSGGSAAVHRSPRHRRHHKRHQHQHQHQHHAHHKHRRHHPHRRQLPQQDGGGRVEGGVDSGVESGEEDGTAAGALLQQAAPAGSQTGEASPPEAPERAAGQGQRPPPQGASVPSTAPTGQRLPPVRALWPPPGASAAAADPHAAAAAAAAAAAGEPPASGGAGSAAAGTAPCSLAGTLPTPTPTTASAMAPPGAPATAVGAAGRAPLVEGSLLHRVQVLEVAMDAALTANCLALQQLADMRRQQRQRQQHDTADSAQRQAHELAPACPQPLGSAAAATAGDGGAGRDGQGEGTLHAGGGNSNVRDRLPTTTAAAARGRFPPQELHTGAADPTASAAAVAQRAAAGRQPVSVRTLMPPRDPPPPPGPCGDSTCPRCGAGCVMM